MFLRVGFLSRKRFLRFLKFGIWGQEVSKNEIYFRESSKSWNLFDLELVCA
nr:MAG TPA: hypothetical protein [Caudoviricetes sp.]